MLKVYAWFAGWRSVLFNSFQFLLVFLPAALILHWAVERFRPVWRVPLLIVLSFAFYSYWDWRFLPLLLLSIAINWIIAEVFSSTHRAMLIVGAICSNLAVLGVFKYANFTAGLVGAPQIFDFALPLGISFFTFHHIMYLVDLRAGIAPRLSLGTYALYICFFPQVLAGPLVRWREIVDQFSERPYDRADAAERFGKGLILLVIGLAKKVLISDPLAEFVNPIFAAAEKGPISVADAWIGTLGFTFQIYFDFSGYTDMALGIALMFGIVLPQNFNAPYRAISLQDFWRRWHMTLSRFLRDYLYIPLGGSHHGISTTLFALLATMTLGGLWHGAGLTFIAWGLLHGVGLCIALLWRNAGLPMPPIVGWLLTFVFVVFAWVLFRASNFDAALNIYSGMIGYAPPGKWPGRVSTILIAAAVISIVGPISWRWAQDSRPSLAHSAAAAMLAVVTLLHLANANQQQFIYFQF
jgi:D-alanyl-lipoteichoic acid acyltransferase DltB (MBOAT superfamily)